MTWFKKINSSRIIDPIPIKGIVSGAQAYFKENFSKSDFALFDKLLYFFNTNQQVYVSQSKLAALTGCSREHVNRTLSRFKNLGIISSLYRHNRTSLYRLSSYFHDFYVRNSLKSLFSSFARLTIFWISPAFYSETEEKITRIYKGIYKKNLTRSSCYFNGCLGKCECVFSKVVSGKVPESRWSVIKNELLNKVSERLSLNADDLERLGHYPTRIIDRAARILEKSQGIGDKTAYFFGICKKLMATDKPQESYQAPRLSTQNYKKPTEVNSPTFKVYEPEPLDIKAIDESWNMTRSEFDAKYSKALSNLSFCSPSLRDQMMSLFISKAVIIDEA
jgi:Crp-like helix-turn-helix domain